MKLDMAGLQAFVAIVDKGSFHHAGEHLSVTQTAVSHRLQKLEQQLGVKLLDRTSRAWSLTTVGTRLIPKARRLVHDFEATVLEVRDMKQQRRGPVVIACVASVALHLLPDVLSRYTTRFPGNAVKILDGMVPEVLDAVLTRHAEFGITIMTRHHPDLETTTVAEDPFVLMCRDDHPLANRRTVRWHDLQKYDIASIGPGSAHEMLINRVTTRLKIAFAGTFQMQHASLALGLVATGACAALVPSMTRRKGMYPRVRMIPLIRPRLVREVALIKCRGTTLSPAAEAFHEMVTEASRNFNNSVLQGMRA